MGIETRWTRVSGALNGLVAIAMTALALCGCATGTQPKLATCLDDSANCITQRKSTLDAMLADPNRLWISQAPSPRVYATGVRLFAWRKSRDKLTCKELAAGIIETDGARKNLSGKIAGASKTRLGQIIALSDDVNTELKRTSRKKRCPKP